MPSRETSGACARLSGCTPCDSLLSWRCLSFSSRADANAYACSGEDDGIGHWLWALGIPSTDITGTIAELQDEYGDAVTSTGTSSQDVEYSDGETWPVTGGHTLIEDETGSYLLSYPMTQGGTVMLRVTTACGVLR